MHMIDFSNDRANIAFVGQLPWHGLGSRLPENADIDQWRIAAGLNWKIERAPVKFTTDEGDQQVWGENSVLYRSDTKAPLSIMSTNRYNIVQPGEVLEFYREMVQGSQFTIETAGSLSGGRRIWAMARSTGQIRIGGQDLVLPYLLLATSCDGTMSTVADFTTIRVVCNNTLTMAVGANGKKAGIRIPHSRKFNKDDVLNQLGLIGDRQQTFMEDVDVLAQTRVTDEKAVNYFVELYAKKNQKGEIENLKTVEATVNRLMDLWKNGPGAELRSANGTAWGLVNAVTRYTDFEGRNRNNDTRFNSGQFGNGANTKKAAFDEGLKLAA